jgi:hypothetical protein
MVSLGMSLACVNGMSSNNNPYKESAMYDDDFNPTEFECCDELDTLDLIALDLEFNDDGTGQGYSDLEFPEGVIDPDSISKCDSLVDEDDLEDVPF